MQTLRTESLLEGLAFPEGPRWHAGRLWFSDMHSQEVVAVGLDGQRETIVTVPGDPSGLGWGADGRLLVVSMRDRRLLRLEDDGGLGQVADLSGLASFHCNDMVVDQKGRAYVGNFGWDLHGGGQPQGATLAMVTADGHVHAVAKDLEFPNGSVISDDGRRLIIGETMGRRLTAFDIGDDGMLGNRRVFAQLEGILPDGICLDAEGAVWVASPISHGCFRVLEGGEITHKVEVDTQAFACMLGGPERRHLFICTAGDSQPQVCASNRDGRIEVVEVDVPGAGLP
jgi:sugar lactone lactonase YvrE